MILILISDFGLSRKRKPKLYYCGDLRRLRLFTSPFGHQLRFLASLGSGLQTPVERTLLPDVDVSDYHVAMKTRISRTRSCQTQCRWSAPGAEGFERYSERDNEEDFDIEEKENDRDGIKT
jgi:hypothetical protein